MFLDAEKMILNKYIKMIAAWMIFYCSIFVRLYIDLKYHFILLMLGRCLMKYIDVDFAIRRKRHVKTAQQ